MFYFPTSIFNRFHNESYLRSETYIAYNFYALYPPKWGLFRGEFLFVR